MSIWGSRGGGVGQGGLDGGSTSLVELASSTSAHTKGSWTEILTSTDVDSEVLVLHWYPTDDSVYYLMDIAVGAASSEQVIIENLFVAGYTTTFGGYSGGHIVLPFKLAAGTRLSARIQAHSAGTQNVRVSASVFALGVFPSIGFGRCTTYGADTANTNGVQCDAAGTAHTFGSWTQIDASCANRIRELFVCAASFDNTKTDAYYQIEIGVGGAGSEVVLIPAPMLHARSDATLDATSQVVFGPFPVDVPAGTRLSARVKSSITTVNERDVDVILYGLD